MLKIAKHFFKIGYVIHTESTFFINTTITNTVYFL